VAVGVVEVEEDVVDEEDGVVVVDEDVVVITGEVELDENVDDDEVGIDVAIAVDARVEDELPELGEARSGENTRANAKMAIRAKAVRNTIFLPVFIWRALAIYYVQSNRTYTMNEPFVRLNGSI
jgi:hypothetical protein